MASVRAAAEPGVAEDLFGAAFIEQLKDRQIGTSVHFIPVHIHPYYRDKMVGSRKTSR